MQNMEQPLKPTEYGAFQNSNIVELTRTRDAASGSESKFICRLKSPVCMGLERDFR